MTLTTTIPTLRRSLPDPMNADSWPEHTHPTTTDVVISGISMLRLIELCQTPCVHTADAVVPGTHGRRDKAASVVAFTVTAVVKNHDAERVVLIDGCLDTVPAAWDQTRLIGRASVARDESAVVLFGDSALGSPESPAIVQLPSDLRAGDLIIVPCGGMVSLHDVRPGCRATPARTQRLALSREQG